jgi:Uma2 family endonuclease
MQILDVLSKIQDGLPNTDEQRLILSNVTWEQYNTLVNMHVDEYPSVRMTYLEGTLEIMGTSNEHERLKKIIARLLEMYAVEKRITLDGYGNTTFRKEATQRGLEPDECYCLSELKEVPDIAIELALTSGGIDKLEVYRGLAVPEVWFWISKLQQWKLYRLKENRYVAIASSEFLPDLDFDLLSQFIGISNQTEATIAYRDALKTSH